MNYSFDINIKIKINEIEDIIQKCIKFLEFEPAFMDAYSDEFRKPKENVKYDNAFLIKHISKQEFLGITRFCLYDENYSNTSITPFFRVGIHHFENKASQMSLEWIGLKDFKKYLYPNDLLKYLAIQTKVICMYYYNKNDVGIQNLKYDDGESAWGRCKTVKGFDFLAAPLMYFGEGGLGIIPEERLLLLNNTERVDFNGQSLVCVKLFDLYSDPSSEKNREIQEKYWKDLDLEVLIMKHQERNRFNAMEYLLRKEKVLKGRKKI